MARLPCVTVPATAGTVYTDILSITFVCFAAEMTQRIYVWSGPPLPAPPPPPVVPINTAIHTDFAFGWIFKSGDHMENLQACLKFPSLELWC